MGLLARIFAFGGGSVGEYIESIEQEMAGMAERSPFDYGDRIGRLEGIIEQINDRLGSLEARMTSLESNSPPISALL